MKFFKNALSIIVLFAINSLSSRAISTKTARSVEQPKPTPTRTMQPIQQQQPVIQKQSYKDLVTYVKNANNVWDNKNGMLRTDFISTMIQKAQQLGLDDFQLEALLQTARDVHGIFSGNTNRDIAILQAINNQITTAIRQK